MNPALAFVVLVVAVAPTAPQENGVAELAESRPGPPPGTYTIMPPADSIRIPFEVVTDEIRLTGRINGQKARMLIDNGALWDQLLFFGSRKVDALGLKREGRIEVGGAGVGEPIYADTSSSIRVSFEGKDGRTIEFQDQDAVIMPYDPTKPNPWAVTEGQISSALFTHFVVAFNFDEGIMTLQRHETFDPKGMGTEVPIKPKDSSGWTIPGTITFHDGRRLELAMMMDLGWDHSLAINTGQAHGITLPAGLKKTMLGLGIKGPIHGYLGTVPRLEIGGFALTDVDATYSTLKDGGAKAEVMVGLSTFQRFHVAFDYRGHRMFVKPNQGSKSQK